MALIPSKDTFFVNPYTFVSTTTGIDRKMPTDGDLTGYITCQVRVKDHLALPDHHAEDPRRPRSYDFFKVKGKPIIPGSEMRGCIRSVYEAVTQSCFSVVNANVLSKRLSKPEDAKDVLPGILRYTQDQRWCIFAADKYSEKNHHKRSDAYTVKRKWRDFKKDKDQQLQFQTTYFYIRESEMEYVFNDGDVDKFEELILIFQKNNTDPRMKGILLSIQSAFVRKEDIAIFYKLSDDGDSLDYFSIAQVSRQMFHNTVTTLLGKHAPICGTVDKHGNPVGFCPACRLFGTLGSGTPVASKLRFSDAEAVQVRIEDAYRTLPELSSPKITSTEFYSKHGEKIRDVPIWTYDSDGVTLNGRKFYLHSAVPQDVNTQAPEKREFATKTALSGSTFRFKLYFDKIDETTLRELLWVLTLGENTETSDQMHKLGAGKPVGYGSVKITVSGITLRQIKDGRYTVTPKTYDDYAPITFDETQAVEDLLRITNIHFVDGKTVSYPIGDNGLGKNTSKGALQWFSSNRVRRQFRYVLPAVDDMGANFIGLPAMVPDTLPSVPTGRSDAGKKASGKQPSSDAGTTGYTGKTLVCKECGEEFVFTAGEQKFFASNGFGEPKRCKSCRERRKNGRRS